MHQKGGEMTGRVTRNIEAKTGTAVARRTVLSMLGALVVLPRQGVASEVIELHWADLVPEGAPAIPDALQGFVDHGGASLLNQQPASTGVRDDWNGRTIRMPGYIVPIDYAGEGVTTFILVPYVGACIHVPPPPANQLVLVTTEEPYMSSGLFEPVYVTGIFGTSETSTELAQVGYEMAALKVEPYRF
jgi:hypothetical protein